MSKTDLTKKFAKRLREAMIAAGYNSSRSIHGVQIDELANWIECSTQICRKYLRGEAIPELMKIQIIAQKLHISPGWLLFGDGDRQIQHSTDSIVISKSLLKYIFNKAQILYTNERSIKGLTDFLLVLITDISNINADEEQLKKVIDLTLSSVEYFK